MLLLGLDDLKHINDTYGHLVGSRALCRLANQIRVHSRAIDTAARYGGDEFALVLPETGAAGAEQVARRIADRLANDGEQPPLSVSVGAADRVLYRKKSFSSRKFLDITSSALSFHGECERVRSRCRVLVRAKSYEGAVASFRGIDNDR